MRYVPVHDHSPGKDAARRSTVRRRRRPAGAAAVKARVARLVRRVVRAALVRYVRAQPKVEAYDGADRRVVILLTTAWGMGGTIRANFNLAGHLAAKGFDVEIVSVMRGRPTPFFGAFPEGVRVTSLEDRRPPVLAGRLPLTQRILRRLPSVLMHPQDRTYKGWNLWVDVRLVRHLRGRTGTLIGTRPGLNLLAGELALPGFATIGEEQMHFEHHRPELRKAMVRGYRRLDSLTVLTSRDKATYEEHLEGRVKVVTIPNTVRDMGGGSADLSLPVVLAAGRLSPQKGFDLLIRAWESIAHRHPGWRLRICGDGPRRPELEELIRESEHAGTISLEKAAGDLGAEMERASIFALSSRFEGLPLILLEAMSKGLAVASFDCPTGPADVVEHRVSGLLVPEADVDAMAAALSELMADEQLRRSCGAAAVDAARRYTMEAVGARWDALLSELSAARAPRPSPDMPARPPTAGTPT